jgi:hypothetical protein
MGSGMVEILKLRQKIQITVKMSLTQSEGLTSRGTLERKALRAIFFESLQTPSSLLRALSKTQDFLF